MGDHFANQGEEKVGDRIDVVATLMVCRGPDVFSKKSLLVISAGPFGLYIYFLKNKRWETFFVLSGQVDIFVIKFTYL